MASSERPETSGSWRTGSPTRSSAEVMPISPARPAWVAGKRASTRAPRDISAAHQAESVLTGTERVAQVPGFAAKAAPSRTAKAGSASGRTST